MRRACDSRKMERSEKQFKVESAKVRPDGTEKCKTSPMQVRAPSLESPLDPSYVYTYTCIQVYAHTRIHVHMYTQTVVCVCVCQSSRTTCCVGS